VVVVVVEITTGNSEFTSAVFSSGNKVHSEYELPPDSPNTPSISREVVGDDDALLPHKAINAVNIYDKYIFTNLNDDDNETHHNEFEN